MEWVNYASCYFLSEDNLLRRQASIRCSAVRHESAMDKLSGLTVTKPSLIADSSKLIRMSAATPCSEPTGAANPSNGSHPAATVHTSYTTSSTSRRTLGTLVPQPSSSTTIRFCDVFFTTSASIASSHCWYLSVCCQIRGITFGQTSPNMTTSGRSG